MFEACCITSQCSMFIIKIASLTFFDKPSNVSRDLDFLMLFPMFSLSAQRVETSVSPPFL